MTDIISQISAYIPRNEQEEADKAIILQLLNTVPDIFSRDNLLCHMTASAWVTNPGRDRVLMAYHNLYDSWAWLGGHADGDTDLLRVAMKEVREESGIGSLCLIGGGICSIEVLTVDGHEKQGKYVPSHLHLNVTYLLEADDTAPLRSKPDENSAVAWFSPEEAIEKSTEPWFRERIYAKLNARLKENA